MAFLPAPFGSQSAGLDAASLRCRPILPQTDNAKLAMTRRKSLQQQAGGPLTPRQRKVWTRMCSPQPPSDQLHHHVIIMTSP
jgi:hypothetical protein